MQTSSKLKIFYISELNLPSKSAYSIHVMKMCEAFSQIGYSTNLFTINAKNSTKIFKSYNVKYKFQINSVFNSPLQLNLLLRFLFSFKILIKGLKDQSIIISRSIIFALIASIYKKNVILELHHEITGFSKFLYFFLNFFGLIDNLKFIFLHKQLRKLYSVDLKKNIVLDDATNIDNFKLNKQKKLKNTCVYIGNFFEGKGIEQIYRLAKINKKISFHLYGDKKFLTKKKLERNIKVFDYIDYVNVPKILAQYQIALMPYQKKVRGRGLIWLEKYMSPLKMFDYMAAKMIIIASDISVYKHVLVNNYNCKLVKVNDDLKWSKVIQETLRKKNKNKRLIKNAFLTVKRFTWEKRAKKIVNFNKN